MISCIFEDGGKAKLRHVTTSNIIVNKEKSAILLVKRGAASTTCPNLWALPGGFLDRGEYLNEGMLREVLEETGYQCRIETLFRIVDNPNRPKEDRANVDFVFVAFAGTKDGTPDKEVSEVKWFAFGEVPPSAKWAFDHYEDLQLYQKHLQSPFTLPLIGKIDL